MNSTETDQTETETANSYSETTEPTARHSQLYRPIHDRMLAGVAAGVADYLGIDVLIARIALVASVFIGGIGIPLYLAGWLLIPEEGADQSIASELLHEVSAR